MRLTAVALWLMTLPPVCGCCLWDSETLATERLRRPGAWEAIIGAVPRHSSEYYQRRLQQLDAQPERTDRWYDDRASAQAGLGRLADALATLDEKAERYPDLYTTWANRGALLSWQKRWDAAAEALERARSLSEEPRYRRDRWLLAAVRFEAEVARHPSVALRSTMLGKDFERALGDAFRVTAPQGDDETRDVVRRHVLHRLELPDDALDGLIELLASWPEPTAECFYVTAELLAAFGDRRLAWHAYQRAYDLEHPRSDDFRLYQEQVAGGLPREQARQLSQVLHWRARRRALAWVEAFQRFERELIAAGGDPDDPAAIERFYAEHPAP